MSSADADDRPIHKKNGELIFDTTYYSILDAIHDDIGDDVFKSLLSFGASVDWAMRYSANHRNIDSYDDDD